MPASRDRVLRYATLAAVPVATTGVSHADTTYSGSSNTPITVRAATTGSSSTHAHASTDWFAAGGIDFYLFAQLSFESTASISNSSFTYCAGLNFAGYRHTRWGGSVESMFGFAGGSESRVIDGTVGADGAFGNRVTFFSSSGSYGNTFMSLDTRAFVGFSVYNRATQQVVNAWAEYQLTKGENSIELTIFSWAYNVDSPITMPANQGGSTPVPGLGGLAALACGAAGMRRKRNRVA